MMLGTYNQDFKVNITSLYLNAYGSILTGLIQECELLTVCLGHSTYSVYHFVSFLSLIPPLFSLLFNSVDCPVSVSLVRTLIGTDFM